MCNYSLEKVQLGNRGRCDCILDDDTKESPIFHALHETNTRNAQRCRHRSRVLGFACGVQKVLRRNEVKIC